MLLDKFFRLEGIFYVLWIVIKSVNMLLFILHKKKISLCCFEYFIDTKVFHASIVVIEVCMYVQDDTEVWIGYICYFLKMSSVESKLESKGRE